MATKINFINEKSGPVSLNSLNKGDIFSFGKRLGLAMDTGDAVWLDNGENFSDEEYFDFASPCLLKVDVTIDVKF